MSTQARHRSNGRFKVQSYARHQSYMNIVIVLPTRKIDAVVEIMLKEEKRRVRSQITGNKNPAIGFNPRARSRIP